MKINKIFACLALFAAASHALAAPLDQTQVAEDAQWLIHVDVSQVRASSIGVYGIDVAKAMINQEWGPVSVNIDALLQEVDSITAYGTSFEKDAAGKGVLLLSAGEKAQAMIEGFIAHKELTSGEDAKVRELDSQPYVTYLIDDEVYLTFPRPQMIMISKSIDQIENALRVVEGKRPNLTKGKAKLVLQEQKGFFVIASLQGLDTIPDMPPQARILSKASGGQVAFGESEGELSANIILTTLNNETATQLSRIIQGMVALASFVEIEGTGLMDLINRVRVEIGDRQVQLSLSYPAEGVIHLIEMAQAHMDGNNDEKHFDFVPEETNDAIGGVELEIINATARANSRTPPECAIDRDPMTYWSAEGRGQWLKLELASPALVRELQIDWYKGHIRQAMFAVEVSEDGIVWNTLVKKESSGRGYELESFNIPDVTTRWIRIKGFGNTDNEWNSIKEIRVIGEPRRS